MPIPVKPIHTIIPLAGGVGTHIHAYEGGYHMADNLPGNAKTYYDISEDGDITGMRLKVPGQKGSDL